MSGKLRLGLIGCGRLAERGYLPAIRKARRVRLAAVADPVGSRCREVPPQVPAFSSASELVGAAGVDALVLATPASTHLADAKIAAGAGLPVLVEKPPAPDMTQATAMTTLDPVPRIGFNRRFEPALERLRARVYDAGEVELELDLHHTAGSWGSYVVSDDALLSLGSHLIDLARWLTGSDIAGVRATSLSSTQAALDLALDRGTATISCATDRGPRDRIEVRGSGRDLGSYDGARVVGRLLRRVARLGTASALVHVLVRQLTEFDAVARGVAAPLLATAVDGAAVMAAIEAARVSAASGGSWQPPARLPV